MIKTRYLCRVSTIAAIVLSSTFQTFAREGVGEMANSEDTIVVGWLAKAPFDDPVALAKQPNFSYEAWFAEGRTLPRVQEILDELLEKDLAHPTGHGARIAYALGWVGNIRSARILRLAVQSKDPALRTEAIAALGMLRDVESFPLLRSIVQNQREDSTVRANACIAIGRLAAPGADIFLRQVLSDHDTFVARAAQEGLRLIESKRPTR